MIKVSNEDLITNHKLYVEAYSKASTAPLLEDNFLAKSFPILEKMADRHYPYEVKLPKSIDEMLRGDFEPSKVITVTKPFEGIYSPMWFGDSKKGCALRGGYKNGDSRYVCDQVIGDADVHMILGGSTGQGKSVTLNSFIFGLCVEYAPWEVNLTLCDAKIVEFKTYALKTPLPHIRSIAATGDVDYLISVLETTAAEMKRMNSVYTNSGTAKIEDFRKKTGLAIPQNIIVIDEFQTMFKMAGRKLNKLNAIIDDFARLGRNTGYHLLMASQELGSEVTPGTLANIKIRAAMGCTPEVSTKILGNDEAKTNYGKKGRLIINTNSSNGNKVDNVHICVPYMPDNQKFALGDDIIKKAEEIGYKRVLSFYDEEAKIYDKDYINFIEGFKLDSKRILLGEPAFMLNSDEQVVQLRFTGDEIENICVLVNSNAHLERYFKMLKYNVGLHKGKIKNLVLSIDRMYADQFGAEELVDNPQFFSETRSFENNFILDVVQQMTYKRKLALDVDKNVFNNVPYNQDSNELFYKVFSKGSSFDTDINRRRFFFIMSSLKNDATYKQALSLDIMDNNVREEKELQQAASIVKMFTEYGCATCKLTYNMLPMIMTWVLGINKLVGIGRDSKSKHVQKFKKVLMDCTEVNIRFIMFTTTMEDMDDLRNGIRWFILDDTPTRELSKIKASDDYPTQKSAVLGVLFDQIAAEDRCVKFKKLILDDEIV